MNFHEIFGRVDLETLDTKQTITLSEVTQMADMEPRFFSFLPLCISLFLVIIQLIHYSFLASRIFDQSKKFGKV